MKGAREYAELFVTGQHGKLFFVSGEHARGRTFHVWVLPSDEKINTKPWLVKDAVEVYGITGGHPGWTETYGWLHEGRWQNDFYRIVTERKVAIKEAKRKNELARAEKAISDDDRKIKLLGNY